MIRALILAVSILFAAPAYWTQKSIGTNPVAPFTLSRLDTTIDGQIHDTADTVRAAGRKAWTDSANVNARGWITIATARTAISDSMATARAYTLARIHDSAITMRQRLADSSTTLRLALTDPAEVRVIVHDTSLSIRAAIPTGGPWLPLAAGSGSPLTGDLYGTRAVLTTTADAPISIVHNLAGGLTHPFQAFNSGMVAGNQYNFDFGQAASTNNAANFGFKYVGAGLSTNYVTLGMYGANDLLTVNGRADARLTGSGPSLTFRNLSAGTNEKVWTWSNAGSALTLYAYDDAKSVGSGAISISRTGATATNLLINPAQVDVTALNGGGIAKAAGGTGRLGIASAPDFPTLNQSTTGNAATATALQTARTFTIGSTGKAFDGTGNVSWTLAEIGAQTAGSYLPVNNPTFTGVLTGPQLSLNGAGSATIGNGPYVATQTTGGVAGWLLQLGAANTWDIYGLSAGNWVKQGYYSLGGNLNLNGTVTAASAKIGSSTGFVRSASGVYSASPLIASDIPALSYQPLENQRLSTTNSPTFFGIVGTGTISTAYAGGSSGSVVGGNAGMGSWYYTPNSAWFGRSGENAATGSGSGLIFAYGNAYLTAPAGGSSILGPNTALSGTTTLSSLTGATTRMATINEAGQVGATTWANDGPWLPLTGNKTLTGYLIMGADLYINSGWKVRGAGWYTNDFGLFATTSYTFDGFAGYAFASSASLNGSTFLNGQTFFHRINVTSTTYTLPAVAVGETILLTFDVASCAVTSSSSQSVTWRQASGVNATAAANTLFDSFGYGSGLRICSVWLTGISASRVDIRG